MEGAAPCSQKASTSGSCPCSVGWPSRRGAYLNVHHAAESEGGNFLAPVCVAIVALAFASALAVPVMLTLWRNGHRVLACAAFVGLVAGESYGFALDLAIADRKAECSATRGSVKYCDQLRARERRHVPRCRNFPCRALKDLSKTTAWRRIRSS